MRVPVIGRVARIGNSRGDKLAWVNQDLQAWCAWRSNRSRLTKRWR